MMFVYIALAALLAGLVKGTSGFGSSLVALPLLTKIIEIKNQMILDLFNRIILVKKSITYNDFINDKGITDILESR